jgi:hypothetical protein
MMNMLDSNWALNIGWNILLTLPTRLEATVDCLVCNEFNFLLTQ